MNYRSNTLTLLVLTFCSGLANAQLNTFDLSKYKTADYSRRILTFSGNLSGDYSEDKKNEGYDDYSKNFSLNLDLDYSSFKNSRKAQQETYINFRLRPNDYGFGSHSQSTSSFYSYSSSKDNRNGSELSFYSANRIYFKTNKFFEINPNGSLTADFNKHETKITNSGNTIEDTEKKESLSGDLSLPVRIGAGRIENVEDARMAIFILEDFQKNNQLSKAISDDDILLFAEKITQLRNMRHFDSRKRRIYEIQALDSFIRENGLSNSQDAVYFSSIIDNWGYAYNPWRLSGNRFSIGMGPTVGYSVQNKLSEEKTSIFRKGLAMSILGDLQKPLSLKWQRSIRMEVGYHRIDQNFTQKGSKSAGTETDFATDLIYVSTSIGYGFYPDSRSYHQLSLFPRVQKNWTVRETEVKSNITEMTYRISLRWEGYIYVSERFNINYLFDVGYQGNDAEYPEETIKKNNFATSFNLSCSYSIF